jgi:hypothetical protein
MKTFESVRGELFSTFVDVVSGPRCLRMRNEVYPTRPEGAWLLSINWLNFGILRMLLGHLVFDSFAGACP